MACSLIHLLFCLGALLPFLAAAQSNGTIQVGASLAATPDSRPWVSPSGDFAFGFQQVQGGNQFLLSIWYNRIPERTTVWYANKAGAVPQGSRLNLTWDRGLLLIDPNGTEIQVSNLASNPVAYGIMNDTGNFVLVNSTDLSTVWESFGNPTDTLLPGQVIGIGGSLISRDSETSFAGGRFDLSMLPNGNLVLNHRDPTSGFAYTSYYSTNTFNSSNPPNSGYQLVFDRTASLYVLRLDGTRLNLTGQAVPSVSMYYHRAVIGSDGIFRQYYRPRELTNSSSWNTLWFQPDNICLAIRGQGELVEGSGACGYNSICTINGNGSSYGCDCPQGYSLLDPNDTMGSCKPNYDLGCSDAGGEYDFVELINIDWPTSDYAEMTPIEEWRCKDSCLEDCFCAAAIYRSDTCWKKKLPLSFGRKDPTLNAAAFLKVRNGGGPSPPPLVPAKKGLNVPILAGLGVSVFANFLLIGAIGLGFFGIYRKKAVRKIVSGVTDSFEANLRRFTYKELAAATSGFKEELGKGAFAIVYKGVLSPSVAVAVKRLDRAVHERQKEFGAEVTAIAQTHHKNLVKLLGFCDEGEHRLLVYEYMSNGTVASFLFGGSPKKPSWDLRCSIAVGVARGLAYLHEECGHQVVHCDIKPQNVLLDHRCEARIADFGLAKLLSIDQTGTHTAIRGTKGYVAPEWFRSGPVTGMVDVYSFGVMLLEIVSCRRVYDSEAGSGREVLTEWVWECFLERRLGDLVESDPEASGEMERVERFVKVGIWCIQDDPSLRPAMRKVCQMLEGVVEVPLPPRLPPSSSSIHV